MLLKIQSWVKRLVLWAIDPILVAQRNELIACQKEIRDVKSVMFRISAALADINLAVDIHQVAPESFAVFAIRSGKDKDIVKFVDLSGVDYADIVRWIKEWEGATRSRARIDAHPQFLRGMGRLRDRIF
jgi:hypothetical protein